MPPRAPAARRQQQRFTASTSGQPARLRRARPGWMLERADAGTNSQHQPFTAAPAASNAVSAEHVQELLSVRPRVWSLVLVLVVARPVVCNKSVRRPQPSMGGHELRRVVRCEERVSCYSARRWP